MYQLITLLVVGIVFLVHSSVASAVLLQRTFTKISNPESPSLIQGDNISALSVISANGRYITFVSLAENLVANDTNGVADVFVRDLQTGIIARVSVDSAGNEGDSDSEEASVSADGRYVAFYSRSTNLVSGDTNNDADIFLHDTQTGITTRVSVDSVGNESDGDSDEPSISQDGRYVAFTSSATNLVSGDTNGAEDVFLHDIQTGTTTRVSVDSAGNESDGSSNIPSMSADGRYVAFTSSATNLVSGDTNNDADIFLHDTQTGTTTRVSVDSSGNEVTGGGSSNPSISSDGRYIIFPSNATNLVVNDTNYTEDIFLHDTQTGTTTRVSVDSSGNESDGSSNNSSMSADGRYVTFTSYATNLVANDTNNLNDIFLHDTQTGTTTRISVDSNSSESNDGSSNPSISSDGRYVTFESQATNLIASDTNNQNDIFLHDTQTGTTTRISQSVFNGVDANAYNPSTSADGRYIAFISEAKNLVLDDTKNNPDVFLHDTQNNTTIRVSVDSAGNEQNGASYDASISADGRYIVFRSDSTNLVTNDTNGADDIFLHDTQTGITTRVSVDSSGNEADSSSYDASISADGRYVVFFSNATNLVANDSYGADDIFLHDTQTGITTRVSVDSSGNEADSSSYDASISADGKYVVFISSATNLVPNDTNNTDDLFVKEIATGTIQKMPTSGDVGIDNRNKPSISSSGQFVVVSSETAVTSGDTNDVKDVFIYNTQTNTVERITEDSLGNQADEESAEVVISGNSQYIVFSSLASNLISENIGGFTNIFRYQFLQDGDPEPEPEPEEEAPRRSSSGGRISAAALAKMGIILNPSSSQVTTQNTSILGEAGLCSVDQIITQNLRAGARNGVYHPYTKAIVKEVKLLQGHMNRLGFSSGIEDGILGPITDGAIKRMQKYLGTFEDGMVGPITRDLINNSCGIGGLQKT